MAVSDHRPFSLIFAEEENMVLYTAIPNSTNSKSVAEKYEGYAPLELQMMGSWDAPGSQWAQRLPPPWTAAHPSFGGGGMFSDIAGGCGMFSGRGGWWTPLSIMIHRNMPIDIMKKTPFINATLKQSIRRFKKGFWVPKTNSFRAVEQDIDTQLHYNLNWPETNRSQSPYGGIRANNVAKSDGLTRIESWLPEPKICGSLLCRTRPRKWCNIGSGKNNLSMYWKKKKLLPTQKKISVAELRFCDWEKVRSARHDERKVVSYPKICNLFFFAMSWA